MCYLLDLNGVFYALYIVLQNEYSYVFTPYFGLIKFANNIRNYVFFYLGFLSRTFTIHRTAGEGGGYFFKSSLPLPPASQTLRH